MNVRQIRGPKIQMLALNCPSIANEYYVPKPSISFCRRCKLIPSVLVPDRLQDFGLKIYAALRNRIPSGISNHDVLKHLEGFSCAPLPAELRGSAKSSMGQLRSQFRIVR